MNIILLAVFSNIFLSITCQFEKIGPYLTLFCRKFYHWQFESIVRGEVLEVEDLGACCYCDHWQSRRSACVENGCHCYRLILDIYRVNKISSHVYFNLFSKLSTIFLEFVHKVGNDKFIISLLTQIT